MSARTWRNDSILSHLDASSSDHMATTTNLRGETMRGNATRNVIGDAVARESLTPEEVVENMTEEQVRELAEALQGELGAKAVVSQGGAFVSGHMVKEEGGDEIEGLSLSDQDGQRWIKEVLGAGETLLVAPGEEDGQTELFVRPEDKYRVNELKLKMQRGEHPEFISTTADKKLLSLEHDYCLKGKTEQSEMKVTEVRRVLRSSTRPSQLTHAFGETIDMLSFGAEDEDVDVETDIPDDQIKEISTVEFDLLTKRAKAKEEADELEKRQSVRIARKRQQNLPDLDSNDDEETEEEEVDEQDDSDDEEEEDDDEDDDPHRLYCVCKERHDDRFMICCDRCNDWFHGDCVGITVEAGMEMDANEEDYICPVCSGQDINAFLKSKSKSDPSLDKRRESKASEKVSPKTKTLRQRDDAVQDTVQLEMSNERALKRSRLRQDEGKITLASYNEDHDWVPDEGDGIVEKVEGSSSSRERKESFSQAAKRIVLKGEQCAASGCKKHVLPGTAYCGEECVARYAEEALRDLDRITEEESHSKKTSTFLQPTGTNELPASASSTRTDSRSAAGRIPVVDRSTGRIVAGVAAPRREKLAIWLVDHPTYEVLMKPLPTAKGVYSALPSGSPVKKEAPKEETQSRAAAAENRAGSGSNEGEKERKSATDKERKTSSSNKKHSQQQPPTKPSGMDVKLVRNNVARSLKDILWQRCEDSREFALDEAQVQRLAKKIERQLYLLHDGTGQKYKAKYRTLMFNLKDQRNRVLYKNVLSGTLAPSSLVRLSSDELASQELAKWRKEENKKAIELIKAVEIQEAARKTNVTKLTHKGEIEIPEIKEGSDATSLLDMLAVDTTDQHHNHVFSVNCKICSGKQDQQQQQQQQQDAAKEEAVDDVEERRNDNQTDKKRAKPTRKAKTSKAAKFSAVDSNIEKISEKTGKSDESLTDEGIGLKEDGVPQESHFELLGVDMQEDVLPLVPSPGWKGSVSFPSVAKFLATAYPVSGPLESDQLAHVLPNTCHVQGRIAHDQVQDYIEQLKVSVTKDVCVIRLEAASNEERSGYVDLYNYMLGKKRYVVVGTFNMHHVKDMYLMPLPENESLPSYLLPLKGRGLPEKQSNMIVALVVKHRGKSKRQPGGRPSVSGEPPIKKTDERPHGVKRHSRSDAPINLAKKGLFHYKASSTAPSKSLQRSSPEKFSPLQSRRDDDAKPSVAVSSILSLAKAQAEKPDGSPRLVSSSSSGIPLLGEQIPLLGEPAAKPLGATEGPPLGATEGPPPGATEGPPSGSTVASTVSFGSQTVGVTDDVSSSLLRAVKSMSSDTLQNIAHVVGLIKQTSQDTQAQSSPSLQPSYRSLKPPHTFTTVQSPLQQPVGVPLSVSAPPQSTSDAPSRASRWDVKGQVKDGEKEEPSTSNRQGQKSRMPKELQEYIAATRRELQESAEKLEKNMEMKGIPLGYQSAVKALEERQKQEAKQNREEMTVDEKGRVVDSGQMEARRMLQMKPRGEERMDAAGSGGRQQEDESYERRERERMRMQHFESQRNNQTQREMDSAVSMRPADDNPVRTDPPMHHFRQGEPQGDPRGDPRNSHFASDAWPAQARYDDPWAYRNDYRPAVHRAHPEARWDDAMRYPDERRYYDDHDHRRMPEYERMRPHYYDPREQQPYGAPPRHARYDDYDDRYDGRARYP